MNIFTIYSGPVVLVASGTAIAYSGHPIEIRFAQSTNSSPEREPDWILTFEFHDDTGNDQRIEASSNGETSVVLRLFNFKTIFGSGSQQPIEIGKLRGRTLWVHFRVYHLENSDKSLLFSVYHNRLAAPTGISVS